MLTGHKAWTHCVNKSKSTRLIIQESKTDIIDNVSVMVSDQKYDIKSVEVVILAKNQILMNHLKITNPEIPDDILKDITPLRLRELLTKYMIQDVIMWMIS